MERLSERLGELGATSPRGDVEHLPRWRHEHVVHGFGTNAASLGVLHRDLFLNRNSI